MNSPMPNDLVVRVETIDQLFNAPDVNPFSTCPAAILGEAALPLAVREELWRRPRNWQGRRLIIQLPADQITPDLQLRLVEAVRRYAAAKKEQNGLMIQFSRWRGLRGLVITVVVALIVFAIAAILSITLLASASEIVLGVVAGLAVLFAWVTVWDPIERLAFDWVEPSYENRILTSLTEMEIVVEPDPQTTPEGSSRI
jgi:hypothetical protein